MNAVRDIFFFRRDFFDIYDQQTPRIKRKIDFILELIANMERVPAKFLKSIRDPDGLFEIRIRAGGDSFRFSCFFETNRRLIILNAFRKESQKTPRYEIERAEKLKREYFAAKKDRG